ncbi:MAG: hypothetical protein Fur0024_2400 [Patescibacteria group bacterium]
MTEEQLVEGMNNLRNDDFNLSIDVLCKDIDDFYSKIMDFFNGKKIVKFCLLKIVFYNGSGMIRNLRQLERDLEEVLKNQSEVNINPYYIEFKLEVMIRFVFMVDKIFARYGYMVDKIPTNGDDVKRIKHLLELLKGYSDELKEMKV